MSMARRFGTAATGYESEVNVGGGETRTDTHFCHWQEFDAGQSVGVCNFQPGGTYSDLNKTLTDSVGPHFLYRFSEFQHFSISALKMEAVRSCGIFGTLYQVARRLSGVNAVRYVEQVCQFVFVSRKVCVCVCVCVEQTAGVNVYCPEQEDLLAESR